MHYVFRSSAAMLLLLAAAAAVAADIDAGRDISKTCANCHGPQGVNDNPGVPNLAGRDQGYLIQQLKAFRSGGRGSPVMGHIARGLSDEDIENLAAYYHSLK